jgi:flavin reductase (DIM6/NTAB) family NADH-FMN oxidoreductase RutF
MSYTSYQLSDIQSMDKIPRLNLINSISGYKPANLIGTIDKDKQTNLAIFSSVVHLGSNPAMLAFVMRPTTVDRHSYDNIMATEHYTINHVPAGMTAEAHYTSAKFDRVVSEFDVCGFVAEYRDNFPAPYVQGSAVQIGMKLEEVMPIKVNGTILVIGSVQQLHVESSIIDDDHALNLDRGSVAAISGLNTYYQATKIAKYPYARVGQFPKPE